MKAGMKSRYARVGVIVAAVALFLTLAIVGANAARSEQAFDSVPFGGRMMSHMAWRLGLTDAQKTQIQSILQDEKANVGPQLKQVIEARRELAAASAGGNFDEAKVRSLADAQAQNIVDLVVARERVQSKIYHILTPEQRAKFDEMQQKRMARMEKWLGDNVTPK